MICIDEWKGLCDWKSQNSIFSDHFKAGCYRKGKKRLHDNAKPSEFMSKSEKKLEKVEAYVV